MVEDAATLQLPGPVSAALGRLQGAVTRLQAAAERRAALQSGRADRDDELAAMTTDRARLAEALDTALADAGRLRDLHTTLSGRLERAEAAVTVALSRLAPLPAEEADRDADEEAPAPATEDADSLPSLPRRAGGEGR